MPPTPKVGARPCLAGPSLALIGSESAQAVTARGAGSGPRPDFIGELVGVPWAFGVVPVSHRLDRRFLSLARACLAAV
jgi:hypothetical protein